MGVRGFMKGNGKNTRGKLERKREQNTEVLGLDGLDGATLCTVPNDPEMNYTALNANGIVYLAFKFLHGFRYSASSVNHWTPAGINIKM
eukprot:744893-Amorphochlora_amoeboformis.AAC.1